MITTRYRNGHLLLRVTDADKWNDAAVAGTGAWCYFNFDSARFATYGKLYNWYAVNDPRGLAPTGWHVPSDAEWTTLETCFDAISPTGNVGGKMKETGTTQWASPNNGATNSSGFTALPGGVFDVPISTGTSNTPFAGFWWSSTKNTQDSFWHRSIYSNNGNLNRGSSYKFRALSVRCLKD